MNTQLQRLYYYLILIHNRLVYCITIKSYNGPLWGLVEQCRYIRHSHRKRLTTVTQIKMKKKKMPKFWAAVYINNINNNVCVCVQRLFRAIGTYTIKVRRVREGWIKDVCHVHSSELAWKVELYIIWLFPGDWPYTWVIYNWLFGLRCVWKEAADRVYILGAFVYTVGIHNIIYSVPYATQRIRRTPDTNMCTNHLL